MVINEIKLLKIILPPILSDSLLQVFRRFLVMNTSIFEQILIR